MSEYMRTNIHTYIYIYIYTFVCTYTTGTESVIKHANTYAYTCTHIQIHVWLVFRPWMSSTKSRIIASDFIVQ